jgi:hypothetical protein
MLWLLLGMHSIDTDDKKDKYILHIFCRFQLLCNGMFMGNYSFRRIYTHVSRPPRSSPPYSLVPYLYHAPAYRLSGIIVPCMFTCPPVPRSLPCSHEQYFNQKKTQCFFLFRPKGLILEWRIPIVYLYVYLYQQYHSRQVICIVGVLDSLPNRFNGNTHTHVFVVGRI